MEKLKDKDAPVLLITYKRPKNTEKLIDILIKNKIKNIFIYNNGSIDFNDLNDCRETREVIKHFSKNYPNIRVLYKKRNTGLKYNIPEAINWVFEVFNKVIILEDDCIPNRSFFLFCNTLLKKFENDKRIGQISGSNFINAMGFKKKNSDSYFFSKIINCWGWATWKNRWTNVHDIEMKNWPKIKEKKLVEKYFDNKKNANYFNKIFDNNYPNNVIWDRAWFLTSIINNTLTIIPYKNLISNIGFDNSASGSNPKKYDSLLLEELPFPLKHPKEIYADKECDELLIKGGFSEPNFKYKIFNRINKFLKIFS